MAVILVNNFSAKHSAPFEIFSQDCRRVRVPGVDKVEPVSESLTEFRGWRIGDKVWVKLKHSIPCTQRWLRGSIKVLGGGLTAEVEVNGQTLPRHFSHLKHRCKEEEDDATVSEDCDKTLFRPSDAIISHPDAPNGEDPSFSTSQVGDDKTDNNTDGVVQELQTDSDKELSPVRFTRHGRRVLPNRKYQDYE